MSLKNLHSFWSYLVLKGLKGVLHYHEDGTDVFFQPAAKHERITCVSSRASIISANFQRLSTDCPNFLATSR